MGPSPDRSEAEADRRSGELDVAVRPVVSGGRGRGPWRVMGAIAAVIGLAILASRWFPVVSPSASIDLSTPSPAVARSSPAAPPTDAPIRAMTSSELRDALADGTLDGALVIVDGSMERRPIPCPSGVADCWELGLVGLEGVPIAVDRAVADAVAADVPGGTLALRAGGRTLIYLGVVQGGIEEALSVQDIVDTATQSAPGPAAPDALVAVRGWLVVPGLGLCDRVSGATPCPATTPMLTDAEPGPDGLIASGQVVRVQVDEGALLWIDRTVTPGPFLLRSIATRGDDLPRWQVVATLDPGRTVRVTGS